MTVPLLQSLKGMLFFRTQQQDDDALYPVPSRPHAVPFQRALSCDVRFCSWLGQEGYIQALVTVNPAAREKEDKLTGLYAFQLTALRKGDLDSSYHLLPMCPYMDIGKENRRMNQYFVLMRNEKAKKKWSWLGTRTEKEGGGRVGSTTSTASSKHFWEESGMLCGGLDLLSFSSRD